ncbi:MAG TPA: hypothetical protein VGG20_04305 [Thermoanaerobaculia bacterium]|jgi:hypothetical protein
MQPRFRQLQGWAAGLCLAALSLASPAVAQRPLGPTFPINAPSAALVELSSLAMNARGDFVVTWVRLPAHTGEVLELRARRFAADGTPETGEITVVDNPEPGLETSQVAVRDDGSFVVVLRRFPELVARRFGADGSFAGETVVAMSTEGRFFGLALLPHGGFVLTWVTANFSYARIFDADGEPAGPVRRVGAGGPPAVAAEPDGGFVVAWIAARPDRDPSFNDPYLVARRFDAGGARVGGPIVVQEPLPSGIISRLEIASDEAGAFLVLWQGTIGTGPRADGIYARRLDADGNPLTGLLRLEGGNALSPKLAMDRDGDFVVAWLQLGAGPNGQTGAFAQRFTADGAPFRPAFRMDTAGSSEPLVASDARGNFVVVGAVPRQIFGRRYRPR